MCSTYEALLHVQRPACCARCWGTDCRCRRERAGVALLLLRLRTLALASCCPREGALLRELRPGLPPAPWPPSRPPPPGRARPKKRRHHRPPAQPRGRAPAGRCIRRRQRRGRRRRATRRPRSTTPDPRPGVPPRAAASRGAPSDLPAIAPNNSHCRIARVATAHAGFAKYCRLASPSRTEPSLRSHPPTPPARSDSTLQPRPRPNAAHRRGAGEVAHGCPQ